MVKFPMSDLGWMRTYKSAPRRAEGWDFTVIGSDGLQAPLEQRLEMCRIMMDCAEPPYQIEGIDYWITKYEVVDGRVEVAMQEAVEGQPKPERMQNV
jgi:hypothetical protein